MRRLKLEDWKQTDTYLQEGLKTHLTLKSNMEKMIRRYSKEIYTDEILQP